VTYNGDPVRVSDAFIVSSGDPASLEIVLDETDSHLKVDTAVSNFKVSYVRQGVNAGVSDGAAELPAIAETAMLTDEAAPVLVSSDPLSGSYDFLRTKELTLDFSEAVDKASLVPQSSQNPGEWFFTSDGSGKIVTVSHGVYGRGVTENFGITGKDLSGNAIVHDSYPNPFTFRTATVTDPTVQVDPVFALTTPVTFDMLMPGEATVIAWYATQPSVTRVRLGYSTDAGRAIRRSPKFRPVKVPTSGTPRASPLRSSSAPKPWTPQAW